MFARRPDWAGSGEAFEGKRYGVACGYHGEGEVFSFDEQRVMLKFANDPTPRRVSYGWIWLPAFVVSGVDGAELLRVKRSQRIPRQKFEMKVGDVKVGEIVQRNPVYTSYDLNLQGGSSWRLALPLFTIGFFGTSSNGGRLLFWRQSHWQWLVVLDPEHDSPFLMPALAFIHREYLRHG